MVEGGNGMQTLKLVNARFMAAFVICYAYQFFYIPVLWLKKEKARTLPAGLHSYAVLICARNEAAVIGDMANTFGEWQPTVLTEQAPVPTNLTLNGTKLTWADSNYTLLWAVCKDGSVVAFTTAPALTITEPGTYTIRAANEMGGLGTSSESITISNDVITGMSGMSNGNRQKSNIVYDLQGRRVDSLNSMKRGIYIIDGSKMIMK